MRCGWRWAVVEGVPPTGGAVYKLVADYEIAGLDLRLQAANAIGAYDVRDAQLLHGIRVGEIGDHVRRVLMRFAVPGKKRHASSRNRPDPDRVAGRSIRGLDLDLLEVVHQGVEPGAPEDSYLGFVLTHAVSPGAGTHRGRVFRGPPVRRPARPVSCSFPRRNPKPAPPASPRP